MNSSETKTAPPIIELSHVDKHFGQLHVLKDISLSVKKGEVVVIIGPSGSGKSTLLNMLAGLEKPTRGEVIVAGKHIEQMKENELVKFRGENVGFIFQSFHLMGTMNALENVALPLTFRGEPRKERLSWSRMIEVRRNMQTGYWRL